MSTLPRPSGENPSTAIQLRSSGTTRVTHTRKRWEFRPVFSPDGTQIAYSRTIGESSGESDDIWTFTIAGATFEQLTNTPKIDEYGVSWQPIPI
ncbi:MAG: hypothetical protein M3P11_00140 [Actinomycetota bacterium]|nr:hypothetical protein [Actinomycetota bacterium]